MTTNWPDWLEGTQEGARAGYYGYQNIWGRTPWEGALQKYGGAAGKYFGGSPNRSRYYQNAFQDIYNKYLGSLGQQIMGGQDPFGMDSQKGWMDYLSNFDWRQQYATLPPSTRGIQTSQYAPFAQWAR